MGQLHSKVFSAFFPHQIWTWLGGIRIVVFLFQEFIQVLKYMHLEIVQTEEKRPYICLLQSTLQWDLAF